MKNKTLVHGRGFTMVELVVTITVLAITLSLGVPQLQAIAANNRSATQTNELVGGLVFARSEATKRATPITVCRTVDPGACDGSAAQCVCSGDGDWAAGWLVFVDPATPGVVDAGETVLRVHDEVGGRSSIFGSGGSLGSHVSFNALGFNIAGTGTLTLCDVRGAQAAQAVIVSRTGRASLGVDATGDDIVEDNTGGNVACP